MTYCAENGVRCQQCKLKTITTENIFANLSLLLLTEIMMNFLQAKKKKGKKNDNTNVI